MRITIGKAKRCPGSLLPGQAYVGRPSPLGNPFVVGRDGSREEVIAKYRRWLWARLQEPDSLQERELRWLLARNVAGDLELLCFSHPSPFYAKVVFEELHKTSARDQRVDSSLRVCYDLCKIFWYAKNSSSKQES